MFEVFIIAWFTWLATCGLVRIITWCFGLPFTVKIATGVWVLIIAMKVIFGSKDK